LRRAVNKAGAGTAGTIASPSRSPIEYGIVVIRVESRLVRVQIASVESALGVKRSGKGRRKQGRKKRRMRAKIRHRKK
jgi:hypothetical protein